MQFQPHLTRQQVCAILNCEKKKFYKLIADKRDPLPAYKLGDGPRAEWRVDPEELTAWIERHIQKGTPGSQPTPTPAPKKVVAVQGKRWEMIIPEEATS